jgi:hypothetical protein
MRDSSTKITMFIGQIAFMTVAVRKDIPHAHVDLPPPPISTEDTWICIPIEVSKVLLVAVYKPPSKPWCDEDVNCTP